MSSSRTKLPTDTRLLLRVSIDTGGELNPIQWSSLTVAVNEIVGLALLLTDGRFAPRDAERRFGVETGLLVTSVAPGDLDSISINLAAGRGPEGSSRPPGMVRFAPNSLVEVSIDVSNAIPFALENRVRVRRVSYVNPMDVVFEVFVPLVTGGGLVALLTYLTTLKATRRKAGADATGAEIANKIAVAREARDAAEYATRVAMAHAQAESLRAETKVATASADKVNAEADALRIDNAKQRILLAQAIEDFLLSRDSSRDSDTVWNEQVLASLLALPLTQVTVEQLGILRPEFTLERFDGEFD